jgi:hypothetical protein
MKWQVDETTKHQNVGVHLMALSESNQKEA